MSKSNPERKRTRKITFALLLALEPRILLDDSDDYIGDFGDSSDWVDTSSYDYPSTDTQPSDTQPGGDTGNNSGDYSQNDDSDWIDTTDYGDNSSSSGPDETTVCPPGQPAHLTLQAVSGTAVAVSWQAGAGENDGFIVAREDTSGNLQPIATVGGGTTHFLDTGLTPGTTYSYAVQAYNSGGYSDYSAVASIATPNLSLTDPTFVGTFGLLPGSQGFEVPFTFHDADGTQVTLNLSGPGEGVLHLNTDGYDLDLTGTTLNSQLQISTAATTTPGDDGQFELANLTVGDPTLAGDHTSLGTLGATTTNLSGDVTVTGSAGSLTLNDLTGHDVVTIGTPAGTASSQTVNLTFGQVADGTVNSGIGIGNLTAKSWQEGEITAPSLGSLKVMGDFGAGLNLTGTVSGTATAASSSPVNTFSAAGLPANVAQLLANVPTFAGSAPANTLGSATITGAVGGTTWSVQGNIGTISISGPVGTTATPFALVHAGDIATLNLGDVINAQLGTAANPLGQIGTINAKAWGMGSLNAKSLSTLAITGAPATGGAAAISGDLGADFTLTGVAGKATTLNQVTVANDITAGNWQIAGGAGTISAKAVANGWKLTLNDTAAGPGNLVTLSLQNAVAPGTNLLIAAYSVKTIKVPGGLSSTQLQLRQAASAKAQTAAPAPAPQPTMIQTPVPLTAMQQLIQYVLRGSGKTLSVSTAAPTASPTTTISGTTQAPANTGTSAGSKAPAPAGGAVPTVTPAIAASAPAGGGTTVTPPNTAQTAAPSWMLLLKPILSKLSW